MTVDPSIRPKTPLELAAEHRHQQTADSKAAMIRAMARGLQAIGYTRGSDVRDIEAEDARWITGLGIEALINEGDWSFLGEFLSEAGGESIERKLFGALAQYLIDPSGFSAEALANAAGTRSRWYGESFIREALDMLDSASEIQRDREVDMAIDERKSA